MDISAAKSNSIVFLGEGISFWYETDVESDLMFISLFWRSNIQQCHRHDRISEYESDLSASLFGTIFLIKAARFSGLATGLFWYIIMD
jgi:hypothetical protein